MLLLGLCIRSARPNVPSGVACLPLNSKHFSTQIGEWVPMCWRSWRAVAGLQEFYNQRLISIGVWGKRWVEMTTGLLSREVAGSCSSPSYGLFLKGQGPEQVWVGGQGDPLPGSGQGAQACCGVAEAQTPVQAPTSIGSPALQIWRLNPAPLNPV